MTPPHFPAAAHTAAHTAAHSQPVTDLASRIGWVVGLLLFVALLYWLMRQGWKWRGTLQGDLPPLPTAPDPAEDRAGGETAPLLPTMTGRYHGSTAAGQWLDRIVARDLGTRSRAVLTLTEQGLDVRRPGAQDFFIPAGRLRGASLEKGIAGKVLTEGGLLVVTWEHGGRLLDSGFRSDRVATHPEWAERLTALAGAATATGTTASDASAPGAPERARPDGGAGTGGSPAAGTGDSTGSTAGTPSTSGSGTGEGGAPGPSQQPVRTTQKGTP